MTEAAAHRRTCATRHRLGNSHYPGLSICWTQDADQLGWTGTCSLWTDGNTQACSGHTVRVRQGTPLGHLFLDFDECGPGCWRMAQIEGVGITERDLQWAGVWAGECLRSKHASLRLLARQPCGFVTEKGEVTG